MEHYVKLLMAVSKKYKKKIWDYVCDKNLEPPYFAGLLSCGLIGIIMTIYSLMKALKIIITPKLYLLGYVLGLLKSN